LLENEPSEREKKRRETRHRRNRGALVAALRVVELELGVLVMKEGERRKEKRKALCR